MKGFGIGVGDRRRQNFNRENLKFDQKFSVWATITPDLVGVSSWNLSQSTSRRAGVITRVQFSAGRPLKFVKFVRAKKMFKIQRIVWQLSTLIANIFGTDRHIDSMKKTIINYNPFHVKPKKLGELWSTNNRVKVAHIDQHKWKFFGRLHFGPQGVLHPEIFTHTRDWPKQPSAHHNWNRGPPKNF